MQPKCKSLALLIFLISASLLAAGNCSAQERSASLKHSEIRVLSAVGMREVLNHLGPEFERTTGHKLKVLYNSGAVIEKRVGNGEAADVVLLPRYSIDRLLKAGQFKQGSVTDIASSVIGVAVRKGSSQPDISSQEAFKRTMLNARSIACPDPSLGGSSGMHIAGIFERLGIAAAVRPKLVLVSTPDQENTMPGRQVANGRAEIALHQLQELMAVPGIEIVGPLPADLNTTFLFSAAIMTKSQNASAAKSLLRFLRTPHAKTLISSVGMAPAFR